VIELTWRMFDPRGRQGGQGMVEYALILILVVVIVILLTMGNQIRNVFSDVVCAIGSCPAPPSN
jgi:Flp pilus assembly pilin Flp